MAYNMQHVHKTTVAKGISRDLICSTTVCIMLYIGAHVYASVHLSCVISHVSYHVVCDMRHVTCGMWYVVCGMWHVACGMW